MSDRNGLTFDASPELYKPGTEPGPQGSEGSGMSYPNTPGMGGAGMSWELRRTDGSLVLDSSSGYPSIREALEHGNIDRRNLSLRNCDLHGLRLPKGDYSGCDFRGANIDAMSAQDSRMVSCSFDEATGRPRLVEVDARGSSGVSALLRGSHLYNVRGLGAPDDLMCGGDGEQREEVPLDFASRRSEEPPAPARPVETETAMDRLQAVGVEYDAANARFAKELLSKQKK